MADSTELAGKERERFSGKVHAIGPALDGANQGPWEKYGLAQLVGHTNGNATPGLTKASHTVRAIASQQSGRSAEAVFHSRRLVETMQQCNAASFASAF
jgi:hypothetical protein